MVTGTGREHSWVRNEKKREREFAPNTGLLSTSFTITQHTHPNFRKELLLNNHIDSLDSLNIVLCLMS